MKSRIGILYLVLLSALLVGCAKEKSKTPAPSTDDGGTTPPDDSSTNEFGAGAEATLVLDSVGRLAQFTNHAINQAQNVRINVNMDKLNGSRYGGFVTIAYTNNGVRQAPRFGTGGANSAGGNDDIKYNIWFTKDGKRVFHAFLEDDLGGLILVIDQTSNFGDGNGDLDVVSGAVYFNNFGLTGAYKPTRCWFIEAGPYDCRAFRVGNHNPEVSTTSAIYPTSDDGYTRLGRFSNLSKSRAFNE